MHCVLITVWEYTVLVLKCCYQLSCDMKSHEIFMFKFMHFNARASSAVLALWNNYSLRLFKPPYLSITPFPWHMWPLLPLIFSPTHILAPLPQLPQWYQWGTSALHCAVWLMCRNTLHRVFWLKWDKIPISLNTK